MMISSEVFKGYYIYFVDNKKYFNLGNFISVNNLEERGKTKVVLSKMWEVEPIQVNFCTHFRFSFVFTFRIIGCIFYQFSKEVK